MTVEELIKTSEEQLKAQFALADEISEYNQAKVLQAFNKHSIALRHFNGTTGYGYGDCLVFCARAMPYCPCRGFLMIPFVGLFLGKATAR